METLLKLLYKLGLLTKKGFATVFAFITLLIDPITPILVTILGVIMLDLYTGIRVSIKIRKDRAERLGVPFQFKFGMIKSNGLFRTATKSLDYLLFIIAAYFAETHIITEIPFLKIVAGGIVGIEFWSIAENLHKLHGVDLIAASKRWFVSKDLADVVAPMDKKEEKEEDIDNKEK